VKQKPLPPSPPKFCECGWYLASLIDGHKGCHRKWETNEKAIAAGKKLRRGRPRKKRTPAKAA
jgi:hypothetical protein